MSSSQSIVSIVVSRCTGTSNCSSAWRRSDSTRSFARTFGWPGTSKIHFSGYSAVSWPPICGSESTIRDDASRIPAQNAVDRPTGPAPMTVMSRISPGSSEGMGQPTSAAIGSPSSAASARSTVALMHVCVGVSRSVYERGLRRAQALDEIEERARVVGLERDDELLVVEAERVRRVEVDVGILAAERDVLLHDPVALLGGQRVPRARLDEGVDEEVFRVRGPDLQARLLGVLRDLRHREVRVGDGRPLHEPALTQHDVELVDALEVLRLREQHEVRVAARADRREGAQQVPVREVRARGRELALVGEALGPVQAPPGGVELQEGVLHEMTRRHDETG